MRCQECEDQGLSQKCPVCGKKRPPVRQSGQEVIYLMSLDLGPEYKRRLDNFNMSCRTRRCGCPTCDGLGVCGGCPTCGLNCD